MNVKCEVMRFLNQHGKIHRSFFNSFLILYFFIELIRTKIAHTLNNWTSSGYNKLEIQINDKMLMLYNCLKPYRCYF